MDRTFQQRGMMLFALPACALLVLLVVGPLYVLLAESVGPPGTDGFFPLLHKAIGTQLVQRVTIVTLTVCVISTFISLIFAYPIAHFLAAQTPSKRSLWLILVLVPFWTSTLVKSYAFTVILGSGGVINTFLRSMDLDTVPLLFNRFGVFTGMTHALLPFMVFPILTNLMSHPPELKRAAAILGAGKFRIWWRVTLPMALPGIAAGMLLCFVLSLGFYSIPALLGGRQDMMLANLVDFYARELLNWPMASVISLLLLIIAVAASLALAKLRSGSGTVGEVH